MDRPLIAEAPSGALSVLSAATKANLPPTFSEGVRMACGCKEKRAEKAALREQRILEKQQAALTAAAAQK